MPGGYIFLLVWLELPPAHVLPFDGLAAVEASPRALGPLRDAHPVLDVFYPGAVIGDVLDHVLHVALENCSLERDLVAWASTVTSL